VFAEDENRSTIAGALAERVPNLQHIVYSDPRAHAEIRRPAD